MIAVKLFQVNNSEIQKKYVFGDDVEKTGTYLQHCKKCDKYYYADKRDFVWDLSKK